MAHDEERFRRLPEGRAGGAKIASRRVVNPSLSVAQAFDVELFLASLRRKLGEPDARGDAAFSYSILDSETLVEFTAYSGPSGPSYGGSPPDHFVDFAHDDNRTKPEVLQVLSDFERWLRTEP